MKPNTLTFLEANQSQTSSKWMDEVDRKCENRIWVRHSQKIAVRVFLKMRQTGLTQNALAERMGCTQQYISKILKGKENMSLEILSKLEYALNINLINDEQVCCSASVAAEEPPEYKIEKDYR
ncbi:MAG: helix-turn-helix transcriptional regulator [Paludibacteraceae bacterium]|nr:helix-turn-helix transcriptional regulator [Paludibacteraceae bacterium]